jgi:hypothetical protein
MQYFNVNDVCLLSDGRIFKVLDNSGFNPKKQSGMLWVEFMDRNECSFIEAEKLDVVESNRGLMAIMIFESTRSIHLRLNKLSNI